MKAERLQEIITTDPSKLKEVFDNEATDIKSEAFLKQYNVEDHDVFDTAKRKDKALKDENGNIVEWEPVNRIGVPMQKLIVQRAAAFLCANPIQLDATTDNDSEENLLNALQKTWDDNKLDFKSMDMAEKMMSECEVAELWYTEALEAGDNYWNGVASGKFKLRVKTLCFSNGDTLRPIFDTTGNMIAFGRGYKISSEGKTNEHFDIYTDKFFYYGVKTDSGWLFERPVPNVVGKIPVIYYSQPQPEWADVQAVIDRLETRLSNLADTNDYFGSPMFMLSGQVVDMPEKADAGKALQMENGGDAKFLSWDSAPESIKLEIEYLFRTIYTCTDTPDISLESLKGVGQTSGTALELMFMGAHLKAARKAGIFGEGIQRRINYLKAALATIDLGLKAGTSLTIKPVFDFFMPKDLEGLVNTLSLAVTSGIMAKKTAITRLQLAEDVDAEMQQIEDEQNSPSALNQQFNAA